MFYSLSVPKYRTDVLWYVKTKYLLVLPDAARVRKHAFEDIVWLMKTRGDRLVFDRVLTFLNIISFVRNYYSLSRFHCSNKEFLQRTLTIHSLDEKLSVIC